MGISMQTAGQSTCRPASWPWLPQAVPPSQHHEAELGSCQALARQTVLCAPQAPQRFCLQGKADRLGGSMY